MIEGFPLKLFYAEVMDNNDIEKKGRVQIKIPFLHADITDSSLYPWAYQFTVGTGGSSEYGKSCIPETGSKLWVGFLDEPDYKNPVYIADAQFEELQCHNLFELSIKSKLGSASSYPDTKYTYFKNGICIGVDSSDTNPEVFISHPMTEVFIDKDGNVKIKSMGSITFETLQNLILKTLDSGLWQPNILPTCLFTGAPHGGPGAGIVNLKGTE